MSFALQLDSNSMTSTFGVDQIADNTKTDFDLFLKVKDHVVLYGGSGYQWFKSELDDLIRNGIKEFRIRDNDLNKVEMYLQMIRLPLLEKTKAPEERIKDIQDVAASFTKALYQGEITEACIEKATEIATSMVHCIKENAKCIQALGDLAHHDYYTYYHSVRVATYSTAVAFSMGQYSDAALVNIALGSLLHDIGKSEVPTSVINKVGALTEEEWAQMKAHPENGFHKIENIILDHVPREIILHHHEKMDGSGYPDRLDKNSLLTEVQIATLADVFDALTSSRSYQKGRTKFEALDFMRQKMVGDKLPADAFRALISCLS